MNPDYLPLYSLSCAPLSLDTSISELETLDNDDLSISIVAEEFSFLKELSQYGLQLHIDKLKEIRNNSTNDQEVPLTLVLCHNFLRRLNNFSTKLSSAISRMTDNSTVEIHEEVKELERRATGGARPDVGQHLLDLTLNARWDTLDTTSAKNKVGFAQEAAVIFDGKIQMEDLKVSADFRRRKGRNPTGYHKFQFKEESDGEVCETSRSTDGSTSRSALGGAGHLTSRSVSSGGGDESSYHIDSEGIIEKSSSSVGFGGKCLVIEDQEADPTWSENQRHKKRFSRIRNRVPTGHPSIMRGASDEIATLAEDFARQMSSCCIDEETLENTETNKHVNSV